MNIAFCQPEPSKEDKEQIKKEIKIEPSEELPSQQIIENVSTKNNEEVKETNLIQYQFAPQILEFACMSENEMKCNKQKFQCEFPNCNAIFSQSSNLKRHIRIHTNDKPYICQTCERAFNTSSNLKQHFQIHLTQNDRRKYVCNICNKSYYYASNLKKHKSTNHSIFNKEQTPLRFTALADLNPENQSKLGECNQIQLPTIQQPKQQISTTTSIFVKHQDHIDLLINGYLYFYDGKSIYVHQLEATDQNQYDEFGCYPLCELSHYSSLRELGNIYKAIEQTLNQKITYNQLMNQNNCNSFICTCKLMKEHPNGENCVNNMIKANAISQNNEQKGLCFCNETKQFIHKHSENCGHLPIMHAGHIDYIVNGQLHFPHLDHCDNHGKIELLSEEDLINQQNQTLISFEQLCQLPKELLSLESQDPALN